MPTPPIETTIADHSYRMTALGPDTVATLGERAIEAMALVMRGSPGAAAVMADVRKAVAERCEVLVVDVHADGQPATWRKLALLQPDHFAGRPGDFGKWYAWAMEASGVPAFLGGTLGESLLTGLLRAVSGLQSEPGGSSTGSSTPSA